MNKPKSIAWKVNREIKAREKDYDKIILLRWKLIQKNIDETVDDLKFAVYWGRWVEYQKASARLSNLMENMGFFIMEKSSKIPKNYSQGGDMTLEQYGKMLFGKDWKKYIEEN